MNQSRVFQKLKEIPKEKITTYKVLAQAVGKPKSIRPIANILARNSFLKKYPCYKVVRSNGKIGGYRLGIQKKKDLSRTFQPFISPSSLPAFAGTGFVRTSFREDKF